MSKESTLRAIELLEEKKSGADERLAEIAYLMEHSRDPQFVADLAKEEESILMALDDIDSRQHDLWIEDPDSVNEFCEQLLARRK